MKAQSNVIKLFDRNGKLLASAPAKSNAARSSVRARAEQKQLDSMFVQGAVTATIGDTPFKFVNGVSLCIFEF